MFKYPEKFVAECMEIYPDWEDLEIALKQNNKIVGRMLDDARGLSLDEDIIISLFRNKKEHKILEAAKRAQAKRAIYNKWIELVDKIAEDNAKSGGYNL